MKEEDLIKKLENVELPDIKLQGHQRRLRMALLDAGYLRQQREDTVLKRAKLKLKGIKDTMIRGLVSRQPVWKTVTVAVTAVALILGLSLGVPSLTTESVYVQAQEIVENSPVVYEILGADGEEIEVTVIDIEDYVGTVMVQSGDNSVLAKINLETEEVTEVANLVVDDQAVIDNAKADPRVKELLNGGATISGVSTMYVHGFTGNVATSEIAEFSEALVMVHIVGSEMVYDARIDLATGKVVNLTEKPFGVTPEEPPSVESFFIPDCEISYGEADSR